MTHTELRAALARLGISQLRLARMAGVGPRTVRRWALGQQDIPMVAVRLLDAWERLSDRAWAQLCVDLEETPTKRERRS